MRMTTSSSGAILHSTCIVMKLHIIEEVPTGQTERNMVMKIALLEDNPTNSELIQAILQMEGHQTFPYTDGDSLLQALRITGDRFPYDVAIIDLWLPGSYSGQEVMRHIQQGYSWGYLPFIVVSALSLSILNLVQADFPETPIIRKPFKSRE